MTELICRNCGYGSGGHKWKARVPHPVSCPRCNSYRWDGDWQNGRQPTGEHLEGDPIAHYDTTSERK